MGLFRPKKAGKWEGPFTVGLFDQQHLNHTPLTLRPLFIHLGSFLIVHSSACFTPHILWLAKSLHFHLHIKCLASVSSAPFAALLTFFRPLWLLIWKPTTALLMERRLQMNYLKRLPLLSSPGSKSSLRSFRTETSSQAQEALMVWLIGLKSWVRFPELLKIFMN